MISQYNDLNYLLSTAAGRYEHAKWKEGAIKEISQNGLLLKHKSEWWKVDKDIVAAAIRQNPFAIRFAPLFQSDKMIAMIAVRAHGLANFWLSPELQKDPEIRSLVKYSMPSERLVGGIPNNRIFFAPPTHCPPLNDIDNIKHSVYNDLSFIPLEDKKCSRFIRDSHVTLFSRKHLLPYPIQTGYIYRFLQAMIPPSAHHFFISKNSDSIKNKAMMGKGFRKKNVEQAMISAYDHHLSFKRGKTCVEGGNCYVFKSNNERKAIIGELSIYLSMIALDEQGCFDEIVLEANEPTLESFRIARNLDFFVSIRKPLDEIENDADENSEEDRNDEIFYRNLLTTPVSEEDKIKYLAEARKVDAKLKLTKAYIADELEVPLENIAFIPQTGFHIDMEMFITPDGEVVLHDDQKALELLSEIRDNNRLNFPETALLIKYRDIAIKRAFKFEALQKTRTTILTTFNIAYRTLPAILKAYKESALNYCNGIFVEKGRCFTVLDQNNNCSYDKERDGNFAFVTTGPTNWDEIVFHKKITEVFNREFPDFSLHPVPGMSKFIAKYSGGIHCLTFEESLIFE